LKKSPDYSKTSCETQCTGKSAFLRENRAKFCPPVSETTWFGRPARRRNRLAMEIDLHQLETKYAGLRIVDRSRVARLVASLCVHGQQQPVLVVRAGAQADAVERYVLIDGYARVAALAELKRDSVVSTVLDLTEADALLLAFRLERTRARSAIEEAWLLRELMEGHAMAQRALAPVLGRSPSWVSRRLALLAVLPAAAEAALRAGSLPAYAAMKYLVPLARANAAACTQLVTQLGRRRVSVRQLARLYAGWRAGNAEQRQAIVDRPWLYLEVDEKQEQAAAPADAGTEREQRLLRDLGVLRALCGRVRDALRERETDLPWPSVLRYAWQEVQAGFASLLAVVVEGGHA
jgi:ParB/RepB/Spo0J family partition protein